MLQSLQSISATVVDAAISCKRVSVYVQSLQRLCEVELITYSAAFCVVDTRSIKVTDFSKLLAPEIKCRRRLLKVRWTVGRQSQQQEC